MWLVGITSTVYECDLSYIWNFDIELGVESSHHPPRSRYEGGLLYLWSIMNSKWFELKLKGNVEKITLNITVTYTDYERNK